VPNTTGSANSTGPGSATECLTRPDGPSTWPDRPRPPPRFSRWLSVMVAATGVLTFIMVFFIEHTTGRESRAVLLKLDELLRATIGARHDLIAAEQRPLHEQEHLEAKLRAAAPPWTV
jgi:Low affinity iron permease